jgi:hypothetical protein
LGTVTRLRESDFRAVLEFLREADAVDGPDPFPVSLLESLRRLVPADVAVYHELDRDRREEFALIVSDEDEPTAETIAAESEQRLALFWRIVDHHPLCRYQAATGDNGAVKLSDFMSYPRFLSTRGVQKLNQPSVIGWVRNSRIRSPNESGDGRNGRAKS